MHVLFNLFSISIAAVCLLPLPAEAQLVNIESRRMQNDSTLFVLQGDLSGSYTNINGSTIFQTRPSLSTQVKTIDLRNTFFFVGDYRLLRTQTSDIANAWLLHLRYNRALSQSLKLEAFVQAQNDQVLAIKSRHLVGVGVRVRLIATPDLSIHVGNAYMYEREEANQVDEVVYHHRSSSYITIYSAIPGTTLTITNTFYYQPLYQDLGDYRLLEQLKVNVSISKMVSLFGLINYYYDSVTPASMRQFSSTTSAGLGINL